MFGLPKMAQTFTILNSTLRDAQLSSDGKLASGFKSYNFFVEGAARTVGDDFALRVKLSHSNMQDLRITLISHKVPELRSSITKARQLRSWMTIGY